MSDKKVNKEKKLTEIEKLEKKCQEYLEGWQRAKADYQNLQKETAKERQGFAKYAKQQYIEQLLPLYNNFQLAFGHLPDELKDNEWVQGILHVKDQFSSILKDLNVEKIKTKNQKFDASLHEAVSRENINDIESNKIIREVSAGYTMDGEILVPAKVVVSE
jgi:molecular chaperone GrpE